MRTADDVVSAIIDYYTAVLPGWCQVVADDTGEACVPPAAYFPHGYRQLAENQWPAIFVEESQRRTLILQDRDIDVDEPYNSVRYFGVRWTVTVELWVRTKQRNDLAGCKSIRARLERAAVEALLDEPRMTDLGFAVDATSLESDFSPMFLTTQGQPACAVELRFDVLSAETSSRGPLSPPPTEVDLNVTRLED